MFAKVPVLESNVDLTEAFLKSKLYRSEYVSLLLTGFQPGDDDDSFFIWTGHLADY